MTQSHCESSPGSSDECRLSAGWPPTLRPSQSTWAVSPPKIGSYHPHPPSPLLLLLSRPEHCSEGAQPVLMTVYRSSCRDKHNCRRVCDSNLDPLTPQSDALTTRPLRPNVGNSRVTRYLPEEQEQEQERRMSHLRYVTRVTENEINQHFANFKP